MKYMKRI